MSVVKSMMVFLHFPMTIQSLIFTVPSKKFDNLPGGDGVLVLGLAVSGLISALQRIFDSEQ